MRDSCLIYRSFFEAIKDLPSDAQLAVWNAVFELAFNFNDVELSGVAKTVFTLIKPNIQANIHRWENGCKPKKKQKGSKRGAKVKQAVSKHEANKDKDKDKELNKDKEKEPLRFPFSDSEFLSVWGTLVKEKKWRNKSHSALQASLDKLGKYPVAEAVEMMRQTIAGEWQGLFEIKTKITQPTNYKPIPAREL